MPPHASAAAATAQQSGASQTPHKRHPRQPRNPSQPFPQNDGTVSDSVVTNPLASPNSRKTPKQRNQSIAMGTNGNIDKTNGHNKQRHASLGGNLLLATPPREQAYAGPTFQASPAPSSLPVPKFFSRSVPNVAAQSLAARMEGERTPEAEDSSPEPDVVSPHPPTRAMQKSPLDLFFNADKAEKERSRSGSMQSPAVQPRLPAAYEKNLWARDLDGQSNGPTNPRDVPTNYLRPIPTTTTAQRPTSSPHTTTTTHQQAADSHDREAQTQALKALLFNNIAPPSQQTPPPNPNLDRNTTYNTTYASPSPSPMHFQRSASGPSTPAPTTAQQSRNGNDYYALHYGNRNLSPLFKAAAGSRDSPPPLLSGLRPSGLRNGEVVGGHNLAPLPAPAPASSRNDMSNIYTHTNSNPNPNINTHANANGTAVQSTRTATRNEHVGVATSTATAASASASISTPPPSSTNQTSSSHHDRDGHDIQGMENDLRRILNLDILRT